MLIASSAISLYTSGIIGYGFTAIFEPMARDLHWSYAQVSLFASLRGLETGLLAPVLGLLVDRWGPRKIVLAGSVLLGLGMALLSRVSTLPMYYAASILIATGMSAFNSAVLLTAVVHWFHRRVATASGLYLCSYAVGGLLVPLVTYLVDTFHWRQALVILAMGAWAVGIPMSLLIRLRKDGGRYLTGESSPAPSQPPNAAPAQVESPGLQPGEAVRTRAFWHVSLISLCMNVTSASVLLHVMPYLSSIDATARSVASFMASAIPLTSIAARAGYGWLGDRADKRKLSVLAMVFIALGMASFGAISATKLWLIFPFILFFAFGWGGMITMRTTLVREYFGRSRFGTILGLANGVMVIGDVSGPFVAGWAYDRWGSYHGVWFAYAGVAAAGAVLALTMPAVSALKRRDSARDV
ncbi:MAG: MFS transporter [Chloroflexi bacterium]|nr:MFS transporter [Chloroflexota bacterium]